MYGTATLQLTDYQKRKDLFFFSSLAISSRCSAVKFEIHAWILSSFLNLFLHEASSRPVLPQSTHTILSPGVFWLSSPFIPPPRTFVWLVWLDWEEMGSAVILTGGNRIHSHLVRAYIIWHTTGSSLCRTLACMTRWFHVLMAEEHTMAYSQAFRWVLYVSQLVQTQKSDYKQRRQKVFCFSVSLLTPSTTTDWTGSCPGYSFKDFSVCTIWLPALKQQSGAEEGSVDEVYF